MDERLGIDLTNSIVVVKIHNPNIDVMGDTLRYLKVLATGIEFQYKSLLRTRIFYPWHRVRSITTMDKEE